MMWVVQSVFAGCASRATQASNDLLLLLDVPCWCWLQMLLLLLLLRKGLHTSSTPAHLPASSRALAPPV
jgi:hypothetical protein